MTGPGFIPVWLDSPGAVTWMDLGKYHIYQGFLREGIELYTGLRGSPPETTVLPIDSLQSASQMDCLYPSGFIFHAGRCGSTLLAKALARSRQNLVIGEAAIHNQIWSRPEFLRDAILATGRRRLPEYRSYVVKFTSFNIMEFDSIRAAFPDVPALFLTRDRAAILRSWNLHPPLWLKGEVGSGRHWDTPEQAVDVFLNKAHSIRDPKFQLLDYADLKPGKLPEILSFFGIGVSADDLRLMTAEFGWDAKSGPVPKRMTALEAYQTRPLLPADQRAGCDEVLRRSWKRHNENLLELDYVLQLLQAEGIPALCLKGPMLAQRYYQPPFLRRASTDVDLGIRRQDLETAAAALIESGYAADMPLPEALARSHHATFYHPKRAKVELHFRLSHGPYGMAIEPFFDRAETCRTPTGREALQLSASDQFLHVVLHGGCGLATPFHIQEMHKISRMTAAEDRATAIRRAELNGFAGVFAMADVACRAHVGEPLVLPEDPQPRKTWLHGRIDDELFRAFERHSEPDRVVNLRTRIERRLLDLQLTDSPGDALRVLFRLARSTVYFTLRAARSPAARSG